MLLRAIPYYCESREETIHAKEGVVLLAKVTLSRCDSYTFATEARLGRTWEAVSARFLLYFEGKREKQNV
jgi:hypothetical protein